MPAPAATAPNEGPPGIQHLTITIETGSSDRLDLTRVVWSPLAMFTMTWRGPPWRLTGPGSPDWTPGLLAPAHWRLVTDGGDPATA